MAFPGGIGRQTLGQLKINIKTPNINPKTFVPGDLDTWEHRSSPGGAGRRPMSEIPWGRRHEDDAPNYTADEPEPDEQPPPETKADKTGYESYMNRKVVLVEEVSVCQAPANADATAAILIDRNHLDPVTVMRYFAPPILEEWSQ